MSYYYDDPEIGPSKETSHPNFVSRFVDDFYYDCTDEFSPFGNDDGADLLYNLEDWYKETGGKDSIVEWLFQTIDETGFDHVSLDCASLTDINEVQSIGDPQFFEFFNNSIIAAVFGQYKIAGLVDPELKEYGLKAIKRCKDINGDDQVFLIRLSKMESDLKKV